MEKFTIKSFEKAKKEGEKISMLTAYDYSIAKIVDKAGIDSILVGDSLGMVIQGHNSTLSVTVDDIIYHTKIVRKALNRAFLIADMPFMSYHITPEEAVYNAGRIIKEGGAEAVKLEGGVKFADTIKAIVDANIPVMGHLGMTPQSVNVFGGFKVRGKNEDQAQKIYDDAKLLEELGVFSITLECVPDLLAKKITENLNIPTIGIGAGKYCDGQVLVVNDMLGLFDTILPKFVKKYANLAKDADDAIKEYIKEVKSGSFPSEEYTYHVKQDVIDNIKI
ncbi:MAG: 3-methyl-2-oxobutanoate hydroxymethyltransferase [Bacteroidales bacterium]|jgi:3-methyl-2-oxobutanoate hydroxymethyltransferase